MIVASAAASTAAAAAASAATSAAAAATAAPAAASTADERALSGAELAELQEAVDRVRLTPEIRDALLAFVSRLAQRHRLDASNALLTADVAVLDDISRAPGEALNVLLRLLNERRWHARPIPLLTAIATGNPTGAEFYNEPLDPATLDRFAF